MMRWTMVPQSPTGQREGWSVRIEHAVREGRTTTMANFNPELETSLNSLQSLHCPPYNGGGLSLKQLVAVRQMFVAKTQNHNANQRADGRSILGSCDSSCPQEHSPNRTRMGRTTVQYNDRPDQDSDTSLCEGSSFLCRRRG
jgi:hypothetical protein